MANGNGEVVRTNAMATPPVSTAFAAVGENAGGNHLVVNVTRVRS